MTYPPGLFVSQRVEFCCTCGQPMPRRFRQCECLHAEIGHDLNAKGVRTACSMFTGPRGKQCPCKQFTPAIAGT